MSVIFSFVERFLRRFLGKAPEVEGEWPSARPAGRETSKCKKKYADGRLYIRGVEARGINIASVRIFTLCNVPLLKGFCGAFGGKRPRLRASSPRRARAEREIFLFPADHIHAHAAIGNDGGKSVDLLGSSGSYGYAGHKIGDGIALIAGNTRRLEWDTDISDSGAVGSVVCDDHDSPVTGIPRIILQ